ncbi:hypothetical protein K2173_028073 [Erythroxylum novogranatense]|uniref:Remorin C-terminal domain-containing protein n=1 Tax=Erythroxylum novogranatense TaxID=1862640 RepID=A0AAV8U0U7_9ROSI|nr:hypothetical protein K2173_028073 [Erythroxylum novogranatense]
MPDLGYQEQRPSRSALARPRDASPDSVIFTLDSNFTLFSSASASVDRCSFASDAHDQDSLASEFSPHLAGHEHESSSGPDLEPYPNKHTTAVHNKTLQYYKIPSTKAQKAQVQREDGIIVTEYDSHQLVDSARSSFSLALKECQDRRSRSEIILKADRRRPASLDLNNVVAASSPRLAAMKKSLVSSRKSGTFPSPGTPTYRHASVGMQKGWSSERVPSHTNGNRRQVGAASLPFNNGRTLPSKWEDAERWIFSPVSGDGVVRTSLAAPQRRPKAKSGPLGPPGVAYYSLYSPAMQTFDAGMRGTSWRVLRFRLDAVTNVSRAVSRRDMATQMSPDGSNQSSPSQRASFSASVPSALPIIEMQSIYSSKSEVRDVQVDERVTVTRWSKKHRARNSWKSSDIVDGWRKKAVDAPSSAWDVSEAAKSISNFTGFTYILTLFVTLAGSKEEAKITAWENLQKAKAEAAIRKLEMKLEKKRSSSMDKIMNKLRSAQKRAQQMRSSVLANQAQQVSNSRTSGKVISFRRTRQMGSLSGCFTCHAF